MFEDVPQERFARGKYNEDSSSLELRQSRKCPSFSVRNLCFLFRPLLVVLFCICSSFSRSFRLSVFNVSFVYFVLNLKTV